MAHARDDAARGPLGRRAFLGAAGASLLTVTGAARAGAATGRTDPAPGNVPEPRRNRRVRFGLNYTPTKNWWYTWADWDRRSIDRDLADIAALGMDHIRVMAIWTDLQPNATYLRSEMLDRLEELLHLADRHHLDVEVTVLNGAVSGMLFITPWLVNSGDGHIANVLTDADTIQRENELLAAVGQRVAGHRRFMGFDLSNEIHWFAIPLGMDATPRQGDAWARSLFATCDKVTPRGVHVNGIDHWPWLNDAYFTRPGLANLGTVAANHTWAGWTRVPQRYGALSTPSVHYSEYFIELIKAFFDDLSREVWIEETGMSPVWMSADLIPRWTEESIRNMVSCGHLHGVTWWCSHNVNQRLSGYNPLEYTLGVYTNDRKLKPIGRTIARLVAEYDAHPPKPLERPVALVLPDDMIPGIGSFMEPYMKLIDRGTRPAVVLQSRTSDEAYLRARGIEKLVTLDEV